MGNTYTIRVKEHLDPSWSARFQGLEIRNLSDGTSELIGEIRDQAALHGVLAKIRDLGLELLALQQIGEQKKTGAKSLRTKYYGSWWFLHFSQCIVSVILLYLLE